MSTWSFGHPPPNDLIYCWAFWVQLGSKIFWVGVGGYDLGLGVSELDVRPNVGQINLGEFSSRSCQQQLGTMT